MSTIFDNQTLGGFLLLYREKNHLTRKMLAEKIGVNTHTIWNWEQGYSTPSVRSLNRISDVTGASFTTLFRLTKSN